jgi:hypothetical protein
MAMAYEKTMASRLSSTVVGSRRKKKKEIIGTSAKNSIINLGDGTINQHIG